jgi:hypothetical protein
VRTLETTELPQTERPLKWAGLDGAPLGGERTNSRLVARAVERARLGDRDALAFLYARYAEDVYGAVLAVVCDARRARDITRHAFARPLDATAGYEERDSPLDAWMARAARAAREVAGERVRAERVTI